MRLRARVRFLLAAVWLASSAVSGCGAGASKGASGGRDEATPKPAAPKALPPPASRDEILRLAAPCALTGEGVRCWGRFAGGIELAPVDGKLSGATELADTGVGLCGRKNPDDAWSCTSDSTQNRHPESMARWPTFLEKLGPALVDAKHSDGSHRGTMFALLSDGTVIRRDEKDESRESTRPGRAIRPLRCDESDKAVGWAVLGVDGRVGTSPGCGGVDVAAWTNVVEIDGAGGMLCGRTQDGRVLVHSPDSAPWKAVHAAGGFSTVKNAAKVACSPWAVCVLSASGKVSCAGDVGLEKQPSRGAVELLDIGVENARDLWMSIADRDVCVASGTDVLCTDVAAQAVLVDLPIPVQGVPDMVDVATTSYLVCGRTQKDAVWCWGEERAPFELTGVKARAISLSDGILYFIDDRGDLQRRPLAVSSLWKADATTTPDVTVAIVGAWPDPPSSLELVVAHGTATHYMCARHEKKARCFAMKRNGTGAETFEVPFPIKAFSPGPTFAFQREDGKLSLLSQVGRKWVDDFRPDRTTASGAQRLVPGHYDGNFLLQFDGGDQISCTTGDTGVLCHPRRRAKPAEWSYSLLWLKDGVLFDSTTRIATGVRDIDSATATVLLFDVPGKPHVVSSSAILRLGVGGDFGRRGVLTRLRQRR